VPTLSQHAITLTSDGVMLMTGCAIFDHELTADHTL